MHENTKQNPESGTAGLSDFTNEEINENCHVNSDNSNIEFSGVQRKTVKRVFSVELKRV